MTPNFFIFNAPEQIGHGDPRMLKLVILSLANLVLVSCMDHLTNIDYIGLGYDAVQGNPHDDLRDPGFREAIMKLTYNEVHILFSY